MAMDDGSRARATKRRWTCRSRRCHPIVKRISYGQELKKGGNCARQNKTLEINFFIVVDGDEQGSGDRSLTRTLPKKGGRKALILMIRQ